MDAGSLTNPEQFIPKNIPAKKYRQFGKEERASLQRKIDEQQARVRLMDKKREEFVKHGPIGNPLGEPLPSVSLYSDELNEDLPSVKFYKEPQPEAPERLAGTERESFWTRARRRAGRAVGNLINNWFNAHPETEIVLSSQLPIEETAAPITPMPPPNFPPEPFSPPEPLELQTKTAADADGEKLLGEARAVIELMEELAETSSPARGGGRNNFIELNNRMLTIAREKFPLKSAARAQAWQTAQRFLSPANNGAAKDRWQMFQLERALVRSEFTFMIPAIVQQGLGMENLYGLWVTDPGNELNLQRIKGGLARNGELLDIANAVLSPPNGKNNPWWVVSKETKEYLVGMATVVSAML